MDTTILVERHISDGVQLLKELFKNKWKVSACFWNKNEFSDEWKLYMAIPVLRKEGARSIYLRLTKRIMRMHPYLSTDIDDIVLLNSNDLVVKEVRDRPRDINQHDLLTKSIYLRGNSQINGESICYILENIKRR